MRTLMVCLCLASCLATTALAQRSTPSHRLLPRRSGAPQFSDFFSPEKQEVLELLQNLNKGGQQGKNYEENLPKNLRTYRHQLEAESQPPKRGQQSRPSIRTRRFGDRDQVVDPLHNNNNNNNNNQQKNPPEAPGQTFPNSGQRDGDKGSPPPKGEIKQLSEKQQRLLRNHREDFQKVLEDLRDELPKDLANTFDPEALNDQNQPLITPKALRHLEAILQQEKKEANESTRRAQRDYRNVWSKDGRPPQELLKLVQTLITPEGLEQIRKAREEQQAANRSASNKTGKPGASGSPTSPNSKGSTAASTKSKSNKKSMFDSLMSSVDKQATKWLKSSTKSKTTKEKKKKASTWYTAFKSQAKQRISKLNRQIAQQSQKRNANRSSESKPAKAPAITPTSSGGPGDGGSSSQILLIILAALGLAGVGYYFWHRQNDDAESVSVLDKQIRTITIQDRESLLRACNQLAWRCFGWPSRFWNHRTVFKKLSELAKDHQVADQLSGLYEQARYAPQRRFSDQEVELARELFSTIRSRSLATQ